MFAKETNTRQSIVFNNLERPMIQARTATELADYIERELRALGSNADALAGTILRGASKAHMEMIRDHLRCSSKHH
jgi:site-specific recombinase